MATDVLIPNVISMADFKGKVDPDWCPGCGDFGVLAAVREGPRRTSRSSSTRSPPSAASAAPRTSSAFIDTLRHAHPVRPLDPRGFRI